MNLDTELPLSMEPLLVEVRTTLDGPAMGYERVKEEDMAGLVSEMWLAGYLRRGWTHVRLDQVQARVLAPTGRKAAQVGSRFSLAVTNPAGDKICRSFPLRSLSAVGRRIATRLVHAGQLKDGDKVYYRVMIDPDRGRSETEEQEALVGDVEVRRPALTCLSIPLEGLLRQASIVHPSQEADCLVFYTESAFLKAEQFARSGAGQAPPVESGGVLVGNLCASSCGEFFVVITDVIEAVHAEQTSYSLGFSAQTWSRIQGSLGSAPSARPGRAERLVGNCHGHNFLPNLVPSADDPNACPACPNRDSCSLTSVFVSEDDQSWSRAVFAGQPWQLMHIFGLTPRNETVHTLYGLREGRLQPRGFHMIPDFNPDQWP